MNETAEPYPAKRLANLFGCRQKRRVMRMMTEHVGFENVVEGSQSQADAIVQLDRERSFSERQSRMQLLSVDQVALILGVSPAWVRDHATRKQPHLKCVKVGKLLKFRPDDVEEFISQWCQ